MKLSDFFINETRDKEISLADAERQWPDAIVRLDHEVPSQGKVRLFVGSEGDLEQGQYSGHEGQLLASVYGGGWYQWDGGHWKKRDEKPGQARGQKYSQNRHATGDVNAEDNVGTDHARLVFGDRPLGALVTQFSIDPDDCSLDIIDGKLIARAWNDADDASYEWDEHRGRWDYL